MKAPPELICMDPESAAAILSLSSLKADTSPQFAKLLNILEDGAFRVNSAEFASIISLCDGVSPSDYLDSGASNKPVTATSGDVPPAGPTTADEIFQGKGWDHDIIAVYLRARQLASGADTSDPSAVAPMAISSTRTRFEFAAQLKEDMQYLTVSFTETCYTSFIRIAARAEEMELGEEVLIKALADKTVKKRNRLFFDLLQAYCTGTDVTRNMSKALTLWSRLVDCGLTLNEADSKLLLIAATHFDDTKVAERIITDLAEDVFVPAEDTRLAICDWFRSRGKSPSAYSELPYPLDDPTFGNITLAPQHSQPLVLPSIKSPSGYDIVDFEVDDEGRPVGQLHPSLSSVTLSSVEISVAACVELLDMNEDIVLRGGVEGHKSEFQGGGKGAKRTKFDANARKNDWERFKDLLSRREKANEYWDVIIDGANVGYYQMNFGGAPPHVDWGQIDWVVQHYEKLGLRVLVVMHSRHFVGKMFPAHARPIVNRWDKRGGLLRTPQGGNDDWYWLHASLFRGLSQEVKGDVATNKANRVKNLPIFVSNDELRDHQFMMLAARELFRWKERRAVKFSFGEWNPEIQQRNLTVVPPMKFSERIQVHGFDAGSVGGLCLPQEQEVKEGTPAGSRKWTAIIPRKPNP
jgi:ribonuclease P protein 3